MIEADEEEVKYKTKGGESKTMAVSAALRQKVDHPARIAAERLRQSKDAPQKKAGDDEETDVKVKVDDETQEKINDFGTALDLKPSEADKDVWVDEKGNAILVVADGGQLFAGPGADGLDPAAEKEFRNSVDDFNRSIEPASQMAAWFDTDADDKKDEKKPTKERPDKTDIEKTERPTGEGFDSAAAFDTLERKGFTRGLIPESMKEADPSIQKALKYGFSKNEKANYKPAPGNPGSLYNETMSVIGANMLQDLQKAGQPLPNAEQLEAIMKDLYGKTAAYKAVQNKPDQLRIAAEAAISKNVLLEDIKKSAGPDVFGENTEAISYYGSDISLKQQHNEIMKAAEEGATLYSRDGMPIDFVPNDPETRMDMEEWKKPDGSQLSEEEIRDMVNDQTREGAFKFLALAAFNGGGGANPSDTGTILRDKDSNSISFIGYTDKTSLNDQQSNTTPAQYMRGLQRDVDELKEQGWEFDEADEKEMKEVLEVMDKEFVEAEKKLAAATVGPAAQLLDDFDNNTEVIMAAFEKESSSSGQAEKRRAILLKKFTEGMDTKVGPGIKGAKLPEGYVAPTPRDYLEKVYGEGGYGDPPTDEQVLGAFIASQSDSDIITYTDEDGEKQEATVTEYFNTGDKSKMMARIASNVAKDKAYETDEEGKKKLTEFYSIVEDARKEGLEAIRGANEKLQEHTITDETGDTMTMGDAVQCLYIIQKLHLGMIDGDEAPGLYGYGGIALVAGKNTVTEENMKKCLGTDSTKELLKQVKVRPPKKEGPTFNLGGTETYESEIQRARVTSGDTSKAAKTKDGKFIWMKDGDYVYSDTDPGNAKQLGIITGGKSLIAIQNNEGEEMQIGNQVLRTKQGDVGKLDLTYTFPQELQDCLSSKTDTANESFVALGNILSEVQENTLAHHWKKAEDNYPLHYFIRELNESSLN